MNTHSISFRLVTWYAGWLTLVFVLLGTGFYFSLQHFLENNLRETQARRAQQIADTLLAHVAQTGEAYVTNAVETLYDPEINGRFIRISRVDSGVLYVSGRPNDRSFDPQQIPPPESFSPDKGAVEKFSLTNGKTLLAAAIPFAPANGPGYLVEVGTLLDPVETTLDHLFLQLAETLPLAVIIIALGGFWLVRRALKPVEQITRAAESITQHNLTERLPVTHTGDELERLSISLNRMIARLDDAFQNSKRFVADASHELRTPLTILRGELEALAGNPQSDAALREQAGSMLEEVARLAKIVEQMLALSRLDAGESQMEWKVFNLVELVRMTAEQMSLLAEDKGIVIHCETDLVVAIGGDRARLKQVVVNLLDNAIKYTLTNGKIQLRVRAENDSAILEVADNGIGIPRAALPHVFERFFRVDQSRSADAGSAGLGLSIVKSICTAHGAEVEAESGAEGSCFRVKFLLIKK